MNFDRRLNSEREGLRVKSRQKTTIPARPHPRECKTKPTTINDECRSAVLMSGIGARAHEVCPEFRTSHHSVHICKPWSAALIPAYVFTPFVKTSANRASIILSDHQCT